MARVINQTFYIGQWCEGADGRRYMNLIQLGSDAKEAFEVAVDFSKDIEEMARKQLELQKQQSENKPAQEVTAELVEK